MDVYDIFPLVGFMNSGRVVDFELGRVEAKCLEQGTEESGEGTHRWPGDRQTILPAVQDEVINYDALLAEEPHGVSPASLRFTVVNRNRFPRHLPYETARHLILKAVLERVVNQSQKKCVDIATIAESVAPAEMLTLKRAMDTVLPLGGYNRLSETVLARYAVQLLLKTHHTAGKAITSSARWPRSWVTPVARSSGNRTGRACRQSQVVLLTWAQNNRRGGRPPMRRWPTGENTTRCTRPTAGDEALLSGSGTRLSTEPGGADGPVPPGRCDPSASRRSFSLALTGSLVSGPSCPPRSGCVSTTSTSGPGC